MNTALLPFSRYSLLLGLWFAGVTAVVFLAQTWPYWHGRLLLAGSHADGPFHFYVELSRLSPELFKKDLAVQSNQALGAYEYFYHCVGWLVKATGWPLLKANLVLCWAANTVYLAGVFLLLARLGLSPCCCAIGTLLAAQPFVLIAMASGVAHSLAIPREVWLWPLPWFVMWFLCGSRDHASLLLFYGALGAVYALTYPLWAMLFGLAFGLVDLVKILQTKHYENLFWLGAAAVLCLTLVVAPSLATLHAVRGEASAVLDYNRISRSVYFTKGFRRLILFGLAGCGALFLLSQQLKGLPAPWERLGILLGVTIAICFIYEPIQRLVPTLSLTYPGRLSLVAYLASVIAVAGCLYFCWGHFPTWGKALVSIGLLAMVLDPQRALLKELREQSPAVQPEFIEFCGQVKERTPIEALLIVPPVAGGHYFRVYAERGLWINPKDIGVLSRNRELYARALERLQALNSFYAGSATLSERESILAKLSAEKVDYVVTRANENGTRRLSWPVIFHYGSWELRAPPVARQALQP